MGEGRLMYAGEANHNLFTVVLIGPTVFHLAVELDRAVDTIRLDFSRFSARVSEGGVFRPASTVTDRNTQPHEVERVR